VAADLLAQAEHGPGGAAVVITWDGVVADAIEQALSELLVHAPQRADIESTLASTGHIVVVDDRDAARVAIDLLAPEHLELACADAEKFADDVRNAGAIFVGNYAPAAVGDYLAGVNHVLPTARTARFASALRVDTFCKHVHVVEVDQPAFARVAPSVVALAEVEGLVEHARSVAIRRTPEDHEDGA
jgi:histidinol dehydrogenase